jgi:hypothetical protein
MRIKIPSPAGDYRDHDARWLCHESTLAGNR